MLHHLVLADSQESLVVLLHDVESGLEFAQLGSEVGVSSNYGVELSTLGLADAGLK